MYNNFIKKHKLRKIDKKDIIFVMIFLFTFGFGIGKDVKAIEINSEIEEQVEAQLVYQSNLYNEEINELNDYYNDKLTEIEDLYNSAVKFPEMDYSKMTKTEIIEKQEEIKMFMDSFEQFDMMNNDLYQKLVSELNKIYKVLEKGNYLYPYTYEDYNLLAYVIKREAGSSILSDEHRDLVGLVVLNRKNSGGINMNLNNPTISDIVNEPGQYPYKSWDYNGTSIPDYCYESAIRVLEHKVSCPGNVVYQATFKQGSGIYKSFKTPGTNITTYFCYR